MPLKISIRYAFFFIWLLHFYYTKIRLSYFPKMSYVNKEMYPNNYLCILTFDLALKVFYADK